MNDTHILVVGLPESGKSSFIQALDESLKNPFDANSLKSCGLAHNRNYIQSGKTNFLAGDPLDRTELPNHDTSVELWFEHPQTGRQGKIHIPDERGEVFRSQWTDRQCDKVYSEKVDKISGILLFIHAGNDSRMNEKLGVLSRPAVDPKASALPWDPKQAGAQVQIVDILQFISFHTKTGSPLHLSVLVSAWDTVGGPGDIRPSDPKEFVKREWSMLAQFIETNPENWKPRFFGVSAYGGVPGALPPEIAALPPHLRTILIEEGGRKAELTTAVKWILGLE